MAGTPVRILSIDGGGVRGVIPAVFLARIETVIRERHKQSLAEYFDVIAGTSTGSIIAAGIAIGVPVDRLLRLYRERAREIFPYQRRWSPQRLGLVLQYGLSAPKYDADPLKAVLKSVLGRRTVGSVDKVRLLIPFYDTLQRETQFIKNYPDAGNPSPRFEAVPLWEAALCSSSAPTFFPAHRLRVGEAEWSAIDGGVGANNPAACAMADALLAGADHGDVRVLSLGTGENTRGIPFKHAQEWGALEWAVPIIDVLMDAGLDTQRYIVERVIGERNLLRLQFDLSKRWGGAAPNDDMDDASPGNIAALQTSATAYLADPATDSRLQEFLVS